VYKLNSVFRKQAPTRSLWALCGTAVCSTDSAATSTLLLAEIVGTMRIPAIAEEVAWPSTDNSSGVETAVDDALATVASPDEGAVLTKELLQVCEIGVSITIGYTYPPGAQICGA
jgi:hypothetical protein